MEGTSAAEAAHPCHCIAAVKPLRHPKAGKFLPFPSLEQGEERFVCHPSGIAEREIKRVKKGKFVLVSASEQTHGHGTHTWAAIWQQYLKELLRKNESRLSSLNECQYA